jgi:TPR repeat protein
MRVARMYADGTNGLPRDERIMVLWLKHASLLDHGGASYQLYLYYLARGLDRDALRYERRALRQGYTIPVRLDNRRG